MNYGGGGLSDLFLSRPRRHGARFPILGLLVVHPLACLSFGLEARGGTESLLTIAEEEAFHREAARTLSNDPITFHHALQWRDSAMARKYEFYDIEPSFFGSSFRLLPSDQPELDVRNPIGLCWLLGFAPMRLPRI